VTTPEPDVVNILKQPKGNVTYRILAYRPLNKAEMIKIVDEHYARPGRKRPANGKTVTIISTHG
jgi:hypothetical protein